MTIHLIMDDGELQETADFNLALDPKNAFVFVSNRNRKTYLWVGEKAGLRKRFIGARAAQGLRFGSGYPIEQDAPLEEIKKAYELEIGAISSSSIDDVAMKKEVTPEIKDAPPKEPETKVEPPKEPETKVEPPKEPKVKEEPPKEPETKVEPTKSTSSKTKDVSADQLLAISQKLADLKSIPGMVRDYIVVEGRLMTILETEGGMPDLYPVSGMPDGSFFVEHYACRVLLEDDLVLAVELWRREDD